MEIVFIIMISISVISLLILLLIVFIILPNNYLYNTFFNRKERNFWKFAISNADKFDYICNSGLGKIFIWGDYRAVVWFDNTCSIHTNTSIKDECLASGFDKIMANRMKKLLLDKYETIQSNIC